MIVRSPARRPWWSALGDRASRRYAPVVLVVASGAALRCIAFRQPYVDVISWRQSSVAMIARNFLTESANILYPAVDWTGPQPGYQGREFQTVAYLASLLYRIVGQHDWIGRLVAIAFSVWGIVALYLLVRRVWGERHALAATAVYAVLPGAIFVGRTFIPDPAMVALGVTACWLFVAYLQESRSRTLVAAAVVACLAFLTKLPGALLALPMAYAAVAILGRDGFFRRSRILAVAGAATLLPVVAYYLWAQHLAATHPPHLFAGGSNFLWSGSNLSRWLSSGYLVRDAVRWLGVLWSPAVVVLAVAGVAFFRGARTDRPKGAMQSDRRRADTWQAPFFFHWWLVGCAVFYLIGAGELTENPWNFHIFDPAVAALAGAAIVSMTAAALPVVGRTRAAVGAGAIVLVLLVAGQLDRADLYSPFSGSGRRMGLSLGRLSSSGDTLITIAGDPGDPVALYYANRRGWVFPVIDIRRAPWQDVPADDLAIEMTETARAQGADWFGIVSHWHAYIEAQRPRFAAYLRERWSEAERTGRWIIYRAGRSS